MKLAGRDVFRWRDRRWRYISPDTTEPHAWIIDLEDRNAWPTKVPVSAIADCERDDGSVAMATPQLSPATREKVETDYARLKLVLAAGTDLFDKNKRKAVIARVSDQVGCCRKTLEKLLRRYWQRGMTKFALLPDYKNCGRRQGGATAGRGRRPRRKYDIYQVTPDDFPRFKALLDEWLADPRKSLKSVYDERIGQIYYFEDGDGQRFVLPPGSRPSHRQFTYWVNKHHKPEFLREKRVGKKEYSKDWKPKLSNTIADCAGVGHRYELDATIADVNIVHAADRKTIIGKATVYLIVDRKSRLIVGFYIGLENPCWETAVEAILSLVESKEELCERYGIEYDPADWPAHGILPSEILADNAEGASSYSNRLPDALGVAIANTPSCEPQRKPNVESRFQLITTDIRNTAPGYDPPEDRAKRRKKHYEKEACLTLHELTREILEAVIKHNRKPIKDYPRSADQIMRGVEPSPIALWNDEVQQGRNLGVRFPPEIVLPLLLPQANAKITHEGLKFKGLYYVSDDPWLQRAFASARDGRSSVKISYDRRSVDYVYVHLPDRMVVATLSSRNHGYEGLSFREADIVQDEALQQSLGFEQKALQVNLESSERRAPAIREAERKRDELGALSVRGRKKNTVAARQAEKRNERIARAAKLKGASRFEPMGMPSQANITGLPVRNHTIANDDAPVSPAQLVRRRMGQ